MKHPFVSIIVPVYNGEKTIAQCIESLLTQSYPKDKYKILVIDNNSKDKTAEIIKSFPVKYLSEKEIQSSYAARNKGIRHAKGKILAFIDADCIASKNWLKNAVEKFKDNSIGCVAGEVKSYKPQNYVENYLASKNDLSPKFSEYLPYPKTANAFYRKQVFDKIGLFEEQWVSGGDADIAWRMQLQTKYKVKFAPNAIVYHKHRSNLWSMFKQCLTWGRGNAALHRKYEDKNIMKKQNFRQKFWTYKTIVFSIPKIIYFLFANKEKMNITAREKYLDLITWVGWEIGRIVG
jgi:glycosyltransferase involved in cell wall biosynthesis